MSFTITPPNQSANFVDIADTAKKLTPRLSREQSNLFELPRRTEGEPIANG